MLAEACKCGSTEALKCQLAELWAEGLMSFREARAQSLAHLSRFSVNEGLAQEFLLLRNNAISSSSSFVKRR
jgi:hypothetical protein